MMMVMQSGLDDMTKQRMLQAEVLSKGARGEGLNLGKKISVPKDVMMEELNLPSNRGSRMFQERQKRVEKFTLENNANGAYYTNNVHPEAVPPPQIIPEPQRGKENQAFPVPGKHSLVINLQKTIAKMGSPDILAPGYAGPVKIIPYEKFNTTVVPKSYCSPWTDALGANEQVLNSLNIQLPPLLQRPEPSNYRCFNRSAMPFGEPMAKRVIPMVSFESVEFQRLPSIALDQTWRRPNFNRAPRGWGIRCPESNEL